MKACKTIGIKDHNIFSVNDLLGQGNGSEVMHTLQELRKLANLGATAGHDGHEQRKSTEKKLDDPTTTQTTTTTTSFPTAAAAAAAAAEVKVLPFFSFFCLSCSHTFPFLLLF